MSTRKNFRNRVLQRREEAQERQAKRDKLTDAEQVQRLNWRNADAVKERRRLGE